MQTLPGAAKVERALEQVYSQPEFRAQAAPPDVWAWIRAKMAEGVMKLLEWLDGFRAMQEARPVLFWIIVAWLVVTALALLAHIIYTSASAFSGGRSASSPGEDEQAARGPRGAAEWEAEARRAASEGRLREASIALYHAMLLRLDGRGAVRFDPSKTPGDYRRELRGHPEVARPFAAFQRGFEPVAFGGRPLDADGYERLRGAAGEAGARG
jgi:hypothetical protein